VPEIITGTLSVFDQLTQPRHLELSYFNRYSTSFFKSISSLVANNNLINLANEYSRLTLSSFCSASNRSVISVTIP
jgi:hypothetical protein